MADIKISALEIDGEEQLGPTEFRYNADDQDFDPTGSVLTEVKTGPAIKQASTTATQGAARGRVPFARAGNTNSNTFLQYFRSIPSNNTPYPSSEDSEIVTLAMAASRTNDTYTIRVYVDGVASGDFSKTITTSKSQSINVPVPITITQGQGVSVEVISGSARDPIVVLGERITDV